MRFDINFRWLTSLKFLLTGSRPTFLSCGCTYASFQLSGKYSPLSDSVMIKTIIGNSASHLPTSFEGMESSAQGFKADLRISDWTSSKDKDLKAINVGEDGAPGLSERTCTELQWADEVVAAVSSFLSIVSFSMTKYFPNSLTNVGAWSVASKPSLCDFPSKI